MDVRRKERLIKSVLLFTILLTPILAIAEPTQRVQPIPSTEVEILVPTTPKKQKINDTLLCNCYLFVKNVYPSLPNTNEILSFLSEEGSVAVFYYSDIGLHHYAVVIGETENEYYIEETNYDACKKGKRIVPKNDSRLIGFYTP